jgi:hypothetical protein
MSIRPATGHQNSPWDSAPQNLEKRIQDLVRRANGLGIERDLVARYARILIAAEEIIEEREADLTETRDEVARVAVLEHGISEAEPRKARRAYAQARQAQQEIYNSALALATKLDRFQTLLAQHHSLLQVEVHGQFPLARITEACKVIQDFAKATLPHPSNLAEVKFAKSPLSLSKAGHTFIWWRNRMPNYEGKWKDMHLLARRWHLSDAKDVATFQRSVRKHKGEKVGDRTIFLPPPPWARH